MESLTIGSACTKAKAMRFLERKGLPCEGYVAFVYPLAVAWYPTVPPSRSVQPGTHLLNVETGTLLVATGGSHVTGARDWLTASESPVTQ